jgi:hypothetical protein
MPLVVGSEPLVNRLELLGMKCIKGREGIVQNGGILRSRRFDVRNEILPKALNSHGGPPNRLERSNVYAGKLRPAIREVVGEERYVKSTRENLPQRMTIRTEIELRATVHGV